MEKNKNQSVSKIVPLTLSVVIISVMMCLSITAWNPPDQTPPGNNAKAPINVGDATQSKAGGLNISGAVGIGTTSPTEKLELSSGSNIKFTDNGVIKSMDNNHALLFRRSENKIELREYGDIIFSPGATAGAETAKMVIKSNGAVGIGTASPQATLDVYGDIISDGSNAWLFHTPDDGRRSLYIAPGINGGNWDWAKQVAIDAYGSVLASGELQSTMGSGLAQLRMVAGNYGAMLRNDGVNTYFLLTNSGDQYGSWNGLRPLYINNTSGNVSVGTKLCLGGVCCSTWEECMGGGGPFIPAGGCTATLPAGNKKIFVTSTSYDDSTVHAANQTNHMANADNACQARAAAAGLTGTYKALMYETVLFGTSSCNATTVLRQPYDILPAAALWNGERIGATANCEWRLVATSPSDMLDIDGDGNYLKNPIRCDEFGQPTSKQVFTNFQPTGSGTYNTANTCLAVDTCHYYTRGCYYGNSASKDVNWAGAYYHWDSMGSCPAACSSTQRALYCVEQ